MMKERRKNCKERDDKYLQGVFCQKCHNEGHLTKECKQFATSVEEKGMKPMTVH